METINSDKISCYKCSTVLELEPHMTISRSEECPKCFTSIRCCKMCSFFDITAYNDCREPMANRILEKDKANFCDFFKLGKAGNTGPSGDDLKSAADALFKN